MSLCLISSVLLASATPVDGEPATIPIIVTDGIAGDGQQTLSLLGTMVDAGIVDPSEQSVVPVVPADEAAVPAETTAGDEEQDIVVQGRRTETPGDPMEQINAASYAVIADIDEALIGPVAHAYEDGIPRSLRDILSNFFSNLREPIVALNFLLQLKPGKAIETIGRFAINTTVGLGGLFDPAESSPFNLPQRSNGFANTLGYYGVGPGPFLVLPLVGATTLRDLFGSGADQFVLPFAVGRPFNSLVYSIPAYTINSLDYRIAFDAQIDAIRSSDDPYARVRSTYLARRQCEIDALRNRAQPECDLLFQPNAVPQPDVSPQGH